METSEPSAGRRRPATPQPPDFLPLRLVLQPGGIALELNQPDVLVGRHSLADVRLPLPDVSRRHCRLLFAHGRWQVLDLCSLNGVFLNGQRVRQATLEDGDFLRVGGFIFAVEGAGAAPADPERSSAGLIRTLFPPRPGADEPRRRSA